MRGSDESGRQPADAEQDRVAALQLLKLGLLDKLREERLRERREKELRAASSSPQQRGLKEKSTNGRVGGGGGGGASDNHEEESERCIKTDMERCAERAMAIVESHRQKRRRASSEGEIDDRAVVLAAPREQVV
jgi:hypothetical protein